MMLESCFKCVALCALTSHGVPDLSVLFVGANICTTACALKDQKLCALVPAV
jgi:hypothetical protein